MIQLDSTEARKFAVHLEGYEGLGTGELVKNGKFNEIGADVVNNGRFSETGTDVITNGSFANTTAGNIVQNPNFTGVTEQVGTWTVGAGWTLDGSNLIGLASTTENLQTIFATAISRTLSLTFTIENYVSGEVAMLMDGESKSWESANGTYTRIVTTLGTILEIDGRDSNAFTGDITNISVKKLSDDWNVLEETCTFGEHGITMTTTEANPVKIATTTSPIADEKSYKVIYTIHAVDLTGTNTIQYYDGDSYVDLPEQGIGTHTFYYTTPNATNTNWYFKLNQTGASTTDFVTISSISVEELGEDWTQGIGWSIGDSKAISTQALGGELITNGDFSAGTEQVLNGNFDVTGSELVTNGSFTTDTDWTTGTGWTTNTGVGAYGGTAPSWSSLSQSVGATLGKSYLVTFDAVVTSGSFQFKMGSVDADASGENVTVSVTNSYEVYLQSGGSDGASVYVVAYAGSFVGSIDNISVKELGADWTSPPVVDTSVTFGDSFVEITKNVATTIYLQQDYAVTLGASHKLTYTVLENTFTGSGTEIALSAAGAYGGSTLDSSVDTHTVYLTVTDDTPTAALRFYSQGDGGSLKISSVSVEELGADWTLGTGWSIGDSKAVCDGSQLSFSALRQDLIFTDTKSYKLTFDITSNQEYLKFYVNGSQLIFSSDLSDGSKEYYFTASVSGSAYFQATASFIGSITNVSVEEIATSYLTQTGVLTADKTWMVIYSAVVSAGTVSATEWGSVISATNTIIDYVKVGATTDFRMVNIGGYFEGSVTGIFAYLVDPLGYWTLQSGWAFSSDRVTYDAVTDIRYISQLLTFELQKSYKIQFTISGGTARLKFTNESDVQLFNNLEKDNYAPDSYILYGTAIASTELRLYAYNTGGGEAFSITDISIQEQDPNDYWTITGNSIWIGNKESVFEDVAQVSNIKNTSFSTITGDDYRMTFKIPAITKGALNWYSSKGLLLNSTPYKAAVDEEILDFIGDGSLGVYAVGGNLDNSFSMTNLSIRLKDTGDVKLTLTNQLTEKVTTVDLTPITYNGRYTEFAYQPIDLIEGMYMIKFTGDSGTYANTLAYITTGTPPLSESEYKAYTTGDDNPDHVYIP